MNDKTIPSTKTKLQELASLFFKLGIIGFGGPAAHIGLIEKEVVHQRKWLSHQELLDAIGATNLIPGPNSTELVMHVGHRRAGWLGLVTAGSCFILPAAVMTSILAWFYTQYGELPAVKPWLAGTSPAVIAIILMATSRLLKTVLKKRIFFCFILLATLLLSLQGFTELVIFFCTALAGWFTLSLASQWKSGTNQQGLFILPLLFTSIQNAEGTNSALNANSPLWLLGNLFLIFLKIGAILYGSGYVLFAYLEGELVPQWLTAQELLDAIAIGQFTPGPILTTSTFIGYLVSWKETEHLGTAGLGALIATVGIFLPSFIFASILAPWVPKMRKKAWSARLLDALNSASMAIILLVSGRLMLQTLWKENLEATRYGLDFVALGIFLLSLGALWKWKISSFWIILAGALLGKLGSLFY